MKINYRQLFWTVVSLLSMMTLMNLVQAIDRQTEMQLRIAYCDELAQAREEPFPECYTQLINTFYEMKKPLL